MAAPLKLNSLDEAASWLRQEIESEWDARRVIDACLRYSPSEARYRSKSLTYLRAALPIDTTFSLLRWVNGEGMVKQYPMPWDLLVLFHFNLGELLACGATTGATVRSPESVDGVADEWVWADERVAIGLENVVISDRSLLELAAQIKAAKAGAAAPQAIKKPVTQNVNWKANAKDIAAELLKVKAVSVEKLADKVRKEMTVRYANGEPGMTKRGGKLIPDASTIKRWALSGIKT